LCLCIPKAAVLRDAQTRVDVLESALAMVEQQLRDAKAAQDRERMLLVRFLLHASHPMRGPAVGPMARVDVQEIQASESAGLVGRYQELRQADQQVTITFIYFGELRWA
jgi:hypothetical protein